MRRIHTWHPARDHARKGGFFRTRAIFCRCRMQTFSLNSGQCTFYFTADKGAVKRFNETHRMLGLLITVSVTTLVLMFPLGIVETFELYWDFVLIKKPSPQGPANQQYIKWYGTPHARPTRPRSTAAFLPFQATGEAPPEVGARTILLHLPVGVLHQLLPLLSDREEVSHSREELLPELRAKSVLEVEVRFRFGDETPPATDEIDQIDSVDYGN